MSAGDDGTIVFHTGHYNHLYCCVCSCAVGKADPLGREWGWHNGAPTHEGMCRQRRAPHTPGDADED